jgi:hypothetical protein
MWEFLDRTTKEGLEKCNALLSAALSLATLVGVLGVPVGVYLVMTYVHRVHSPFPVLDASSTLMLLLIAAVYAFYPVYLALTVRDHVKAACVIILVCEFVCLVYDRSFFGQVALRAIGVGGGMPRTIEFKAENNAGHSYVTGCVLLKLGSEVTILRTCDPSLKACFIPFWSSEDRPVVVQELDRQGAPDTHPAGDIARFRAPRHEDCSAP